MKAPIYTEQAACQDCYKCVRECPVKAIEVKEGHAVVIQELCIFCGHCVSVCPVEAKRMREDLPRAKQLLASRRKSSISLAPSWVSAFSCSPGQMAAALFRLGFSTAEETSIGAELVSSAIRNSGELSSGVSISSACPAVTELVEKYYPKLSGFLSPWKSPMLAHALLLRRRLGKETGMVFAGPCIAKKLEADRNAELVDVVITFRELERWFDDAGIDPSSLDASDFSGAAVRGGSLYPIDGGMIASIRDKAPLVDGSMIPLSGTGAIMHSLEDLSPQAATPLFLEFLACKGGCINGPGTCAGDSLVSRRLRIIRADAGRREEDGKASREEYTGIDLPLSTRWSGERGVLQPSFTAGDIEEALANLGKEKKEDRLNCGGCGYHTCADFALAWLDGKAEKAMCVASMRRIAQKKMNAIIKAIPLGVVIIDEEEKIVECNGKFLEFFSDFTAREIDEQLMERMRGKPVSRFLPETEGIKRVRQGVEELVEKQLHHAGRIMKVFIFHIERGRYTGVLFEDISGPTRRRETVIKNAEAVIAKNLETVQQIAGLLGESAAETEIILSSLIESFEAPGGGRSVGNL